jgi:hypothetical protein
MTYDEIDINLRPPGVVGARCIILASLLRRIWIESSARSGAPGDWAGDAYDLREWLRGEDLWQETTASDRIALETTPGQLGDPEFSAAAWQAEGLATLGWALQLSDQLPPGELADVPDVLAATPSPWDQTSSWLAARVLRPEEIIARERDRAELYDWRISVELSGRGANASERAQFESMVDEVAIEAAAAGFLTASETDFSIGGLPLGSFTDDDLAKLAATSEERLRALNWLCGFGSSWDDVPLDV